MEKIIEHLIAEKEQIRMSIQYAENYTEKERLTGFIQGVEMAIKVIKTYGEIEE